MPVDELHEGLLQIVQKMPAVGHSDCLQRALICALKIAVAPVATDDFNLWMAFQPESESLGRPIWEQLHRKMAL